MGHALRAAERPYRGLVTTSQRVPGRRRVAAALVVMVVGAVVGLLPAPAWASDPARDRQWPLDVIGAEQAHAAGRGAGSTIAVVDSGVDLAHEDLSAHLVAGIDLVDGDTTPQDEFGHGTHVAGIAAAVGDNGRGILGTAPDARIMPVRVLDEDGRGSSRDVIDGVRWAVDHGADVVNLSLGEAGQQVLGSSFSEVVRYAWDHGVIVVVAAGNEFVLSSGFGDEPAVVVSATTRGDRQPHYSNGVGRARWGMAAPGGGCTLPAPCPQEDGVFSTYWDADESDVYAYRQGTSMAAPHVAGAAAVLRSLGLSPQQVVDRLLETAEDLGPAGRDDTYGAGRLDLGRAAAGLSSTGSGGGGDGGGSAGPDGEGSGPTTAPASPTTPRPDTTGNTSSAADGPGSAAPSGSPTPAATVAPARPSPGPSRTPEEGVGASPSPGDSGGTAVAAPPASEEDPVTALAAVLLAMAVAGLAAAVWARAR